MENQYKLKKEKILNDGSVISTKINLKKLTQKDSSGMINVETIDDTYNSHNIIRSFWVNEKEIEKQ